MLTVFIAFDGIDGVQGFELFELLRALGLRCIANHDMLSPNTAWNVYPFYIGIIFMSTILRVCFWEVDGGGNSLFKDGPCPQCRLCPLTR